MTTDIAKTTARLMQAIAEPNRIRIVDALLASPKRVGALSQMLGIEMGNLSHHLNVLRGAGIVTSAKDGRFVVYSLHPGIVNAATHELDLGWCRLQIPLR